MADANKPTLVLSGNHTMRTLLPRLAEYFRLCFLYPQGAQLAQEMHIADAFPLSNLVDGALQEHAANEAVRMVAGVFSRFPRIQERLDAFLGEAYPTDPTVALEEWFAGYVHYWLREELGQVLALDKLAGQQTIAGLVVHEDVTPPMRAAVLYARSQGWPTVHVPHAACHLLDDAGPDIHRETRTSHLAATGPENEAFYRRNGFAGQSRATGVPQLDWMYHELQPTREQARAVLAVNNPVVICYGTTWYQTTSLRGGQQEEINRGLEAVLSAAQELSAVLLVSMHPGDPPQNEAYYADLLKKNDIPGLVTRHHFNWLLHAADVYVKTGPSNGCLVAAGLGCPVVIFPTEGFDFHHRLPVRCAPNVEALTPAIREAIASREDPGWGELVALYNAAHGLGNAAEATAEFIREAVQ